MNIGYLTKQHPEDKKAYSGIHYFMYRALRKQFDQVIPLGPVKTPYRIFPKVKGRALRLLTGKIYKYQYNIGLCNQMSAIIDREIQSSQQNFDVLLASLMTPEVAGLKTKTPIYLTADATFPLLHNFYASHSNLHPQSVHEAEELERRAYEKAKKIIFPLKWLADSAMASYGVPSSKIEVIPYGANIDRSYPEEEIRQLIENRTKNPGINLLFVGVRCQEKGGPFAVEILNELLKKGADANLIVAGCSPEGIEDSERIRITGFLDKSLEHDNQKLTGLYEEATFFILPTRAECVGISFIEAASFGLPAIGTPVGGVPEAVHHNETGMIISDLDSPSTVADWILEKWSKKKEYERLSVQAHQRQQKCLNWSRWAEKVKQVIESDVKAS